MSEWKQELAHTQINKYKIELNRKIMKLKTSLDNCIIKIRKNMFNGWIMAVYFNQFNNNNNNIKEIRYQILIEN